MRRKTRKRGPKGTLWYRKFNDTWYMPKVNGKAPPVLDADGVPIKDKDQGCLLSRFAKVAILPAMTCVRQSKKHGR
jgi:hypothetical protein